MPIDSSGTRTPGRENGRHHQEMRKKWFLVGRAESNHRRKNVQTSASFLDIGEAHCSRRLLFPLLPMLYFPEFDSPRVNLSGRQLHEHGFPAAVLAVLDEAGGGAGPDRLSWS